MLRYVYIDELPAGAIAFGCLSVFTVRKSNQMRHVFKHADCVPAQNTKLKVFFVFPPSNILSLLPYNILSIFAYIILLLP